MTPTVVLVGYTRSIPRDFKATWGERTCPSVETASIWFEPRTSRLRDLRSNPLGHRAPQNIFLELLKDMHLNKDQLTKIALNFQVRSHYYSKSIDAIVITNISESTPDSRAANDGLCIVWQKPRNRRTCIVLLTSTELDTLIPSLSTRYLAAVLKFKKNYISICNLAHFGIYLRQNHKNWETHILRYVDSQRAVQPSPSTRYMAIMLHVKMSLNKILTIIQLITWHVR